jgi:H+/Cl- antiporter ClcA
MNEDSIEDRFEYLTLLLAAVGLALAAMVGMLVYLFAISSLTSLLWERLPAWLPSSLPAGVLTVAVATLGGLLVGVTLHYLGGPPGASLQAELSGEGRVGYRGLLGLLIAACIGLASGASLGPEGPLAHMGGGFGTWLADRLKYSVQKSRILAVSGISAVFGAFLATPLGGAFMALEFTGLLAFPIYANLVAATVTALVGYLIFVRVVGTPFVGLLRFDEVPAMSLSNLGAAVLLGLLGLAMAFVFKFINARTKQLVALLPQHSVLKTTIGGLGFGLVGALLPLTLFSGEKELHTVIERGAELGVGLLLVLAVVKLFTLSLCLNTGFPGGFVFPVLFSAGTLGVALHLIFPFIPLSIAVMGLMAGMGGAVMRMPFTVILFLTVLTQPELMPVLIIAAFTGFLTARRLEAGSAREAYRDSQVEAAEIAQPIKA